MRTFADALAVAERVMKQITFGLRIHIEIPVCQLLVIKKLRSFIKTPILQTEHIRGVEPKADFILAGGTDFLRMDPEYDMGITGGMKIAHLAESLGVDVEIHACGPAHEL